MLRPDPYSPICIMNKSKPRISLVNMPFGELAASPIALLQLETYLKREFQDRIDIQIHYINHDAAVFLDDLSLYGHIISNFGYSTGFGDWLFRSVAFPDAADNTEDYFGLYYTADDEISTSAKRIVKNKRSQLDGFLDDMISKYDLATADIVGFTSIFAQTTASLALANKLKLVNPDVVTVMGGGACIGGMGMEFARQFDSIDYVFSGLGLCSFSQFVGNYLKDDMPACDDIKGVFSKTNQSSWDESDVTSCMGEELDINENLILNYDHFLDSCEATFPNGEIQPRLLFETSRGCWWGERMTCSFCGLNGPSICYHAMTSENALEHIQALIKYQSRCDFFASVDNIMKPEYITEVFTKIQLPPTHKIQYEVRADLKEKDLETLCKAGVSLIQPGIEALSSDTLKLMRKGTTAFSNIRFLKACAKQPVSLAWNLLILSPGEDEKTYEKYLEDLDHLTHLHPPYAALSIEYLRFTRYFENADEFDLDLQPDMFYSLIYPYDEDSISRLAFKFMDHNCDYAKMHHWLGLLNEKIQSWRSRWLNEDGKVESQLVFVQGDAVVYDSRTGEVVEHEISESAEQVLRVLDWPMAVDDLARELDGVDVVGEVEYLYERGLLFEEYGRYMSLVTLEPIGVTALKIKD